ncbi:MAG: tetraacyldisaccharide 4'-kinase [Polaromonas sp.]|nr:MAG: tetraacyldisaccharide 4'-kinase [Polaromonas sp.]
MGVQLHGSEPLAPPADNQGIERVLQQAWSSRGWLARLLWPVSQVYGLLVSGRQRLYQWGVFKSARVGVPVLVVGNVVTGGAGKTPLVMALVKHFQQRGLKVGVVSRGYGRTGQACVEVRASTPVAVSGDEPALIRLTTDAPIFVAKNRLDAAKALLVTYPETQLLVCDDGLQHYALARDVAVVVFDDRGAGNGWLLPAGPLREPWPERLRRGVDLVLHTGQSPAFGGFRSSRQLADYAVDASGNRFWLDNLKSQKLAALAAVAHPEAFFSMLMARGLVLGQTISLPDHYDFSAYKPDVAKDCTVLCTEKDAVKLFGLPAMASVRLLAVPLQFSPEPAFLDAVDALLKPLLSQLPSRHGH